ncbi:MAG: glutamate racemase [Leptolyngbyaceae cyanobacterium SM1_1_3]|nr:glutamate racemase [Leptolyngbyaceae cyanobacterium SM1_1_3]NJN01082.1 glutamate racemase [Leptolyngbyaceae cyanobacterium RM1_1_2]NJO11547.1 glutamate racemase [Leptolyngbyaceae cyanobacterium SL_1_1]
MNPSAPIGVFDSGVGGLSVLQAIRAALPYENLCYVADSGHVPYGTKTPEYLQKRSLVLTHFLLSQNVKAIVVACNTATVAAVAYLRATFTIPIIAIEPAVKPAVLATKTGIIGVIATAATLASDQFLRLLERFGSGVTILTQACPCLVAQVEKGDLASSTTRLLVQQYTAPLLVAGADTLVLGCTHYPFLRPLIDEVVGANITLIDTGTAVTRQLSNILAAQKLLNPSAQPGHEQFWTSGEVKKAQAVFRVLWRKPINLQPLPQAFA